MVYLGFWLDRGGVRDVRRIVVIDDPSAGPPMAADVVAELRQLHPHATVVDDLPPGAPARGAGDLFVVVFAAPFAYPLQDVIYGQLDRLTRLAARIGPDAAVLLYRVWWREAEALPARRLRRRIAMLRLEAWLIRILLAIRARRWLLRPRHQGN